MASRRSSDHPQVSDLGGGRDQYPVRPDAEVAVARSAGQVVEVVARYLFRVEDYEVVADAVHLGESHFLPPPFPAFQVSSRAQSQ